ncbi:acetyltransferase [Rhizobium sp. Leaf384]|jgi:GNAT superfamily N-acetyltransferase|uniref:GNAT family N-acetyltransferase n=1 Tax=unclassified Rhizobium TaxID=2613769 RepID=UPI000712373F|nr:MULTISPECIES: GNAT family N-acetyltransferase [unclassified Rhizobium]KQS81328.1 acetyltransferase [Rhizobium sp. Leaf384]KQS87237.1 acetyltransferase [Rhizobium sp. Leaf383]
MRIVECAPDFKDWADLHDLILTAFAGMASRIDPPSSALDLTPETLREKAGREIVHLAYADDGSLVGCVFCRPEPPETLYVGKLAVRPDLQGNGLGRSLVETAAAIATHRGFSRLRLETRIELTGNHRAFSAMGFVVTREGRHPGFDRTTFIEMQKRV